MPKAKPELVKMAELARRSGVPSPTIKHYIREGLLPGPEVRTSRNMAYYDARLAARIQVIKTIQSERYLPLKVIGGLLEPAPSAKLVDERAVLTSLAPALHASGGRRRRRSDVIKTGGVTRAELDHLEKAGILELAGDGDTAGYSGIDLDLLELLGELRRAGLGALFPISISEVYLAEVRRLAGVEIELFRRHALAGGAAPELLPDIARQAVRFGERLIIGLRAKLLPAMLAELAPKPKRKR